MSLRLPGAVVLPAHLRCVFFFLSLCVCVCVFSFLVCSFFRLLAFCFLFFLLPPLEYQSGAVPSPPSPAGPCRHVAFSRLVEVMYANGSPPLPSYSPCGNGCLSLSYPLLPSSPFSLLLPPTSPTLSKSFPRAQSGNEKWKEERMLKGRGREGEKGAPSL